MSQKNSIVEEALLSMQNLEEAIAENAKGILASTMKQEIKDLVKESLKEQETEDEDEVDTDVEDSEDDMDDTDSEEEFDQEDSEEEDDQEDSEEEDVDSDVDFDDSETDVETDIESEDTIDLTNVSDEELIKVFKAMKDDDGIIVKKDGNKIHLQDDGSDVEYMINIGESEHEKFDESWDEELDEEDSINVKALADKLFGPETKESYGMDSEEDLLEYSDDEDDEDLFESDEDDEDLYESEEDETLYEISLDKSKEFDEMDYDLDSDDELNEMDYDLDSDDELYEVGYDLDSDDELDEMDYDEEPMTESKKSIFTKPKGKIGKVKQFSYKQSSGGFKDHMPQGTRGVGMGKVKKSVFTQPAKKSEAKEGMMKPKGVGIGKGPKFEYKETTKGQMKKVEPKEASRTLGNGKKWGRNGLNKPRTSPRHIQLESELISLREKNEEYRKALNIFREKLNEVAVFNSNLAYATRLFTEHTTSKQEKLNILRRFDGIESLKESKTLYKTIKNELSSDNKSMIKESIENKIEKVQQTGSSINLIESTTYQNPQFMRMKDLMTKLK